MLDTDLVRRMRDQLLENGRPSLVPPADFELAELAPFELASLERIAPLAELLFLMMSADVDGPDPDLVDMFKGTPVLVARLMPNAPPPPGPQVGFAGIGKPWKVERALVASGCDLKDFAPFPDHMAYDERTLRGLAGHVLL